jgi:hypothetical protein
LLRINQEGSELVPVRQVLTEPLGARYDLRRLALSNIDAVFGEIGQRIFVLGRDLKLGGKEDGPRVDVLGLDPAGNLMLTFIQPRVEPDDLANAVRAATAAAPWSADDFLKRLSPTRREELQDFLDVDPAQINRSQRIVLLSEDYDFDALLGVRMLRERRNMDVLAIHAALAIDYQSGQEYMSCSEMSGASLPVVVGLPAPAGTGSGLALPPPDGADGPRPESPTHTEESSGARKETRVATQSNSPHKIKPFADLFMDGWRVVGPDLNPKPELDARAEVEADSSFETMPGAK